jgi:nucleotide-binding universal stress UspA family protein
MYKHILLPTDGSPLSEDAATAGIELARKLGARLTALHVLAEPVTLGLDTWSHQDKDYAAHLATALERHGGHYVEAIREKARLAGVACEVVLAHAKSPETEIVSQAQARGCDLIVMASHGQKGAAGVLLASVTLNVATLGRIPVLIHHPAKSEARAPLSGKRAPASSNA